MILTVYTFPVFRGEGTLLGDVFVKYETYSHSLGYMKLWFKNFTYIGKLMIIEPTTGHISQLH
jgi:hypothetical protein